jgi:hypothetical protein
MEAPTKLRTPASEELPELLAEQEASGLSMAAFARERGLTTWKLYPAARRKAGRASRRSRNRAKASFAEVAVIGRASAFELNLGSRGVLKIPPGFEAADLQRVLEVLRGC